MGKVLLIWCFCILILLPMEAFSQDNDKTITASRGSVPEELLRPRREEAPRYAVDMVIGPLGRGEVSTEAYSFARKVAENLLAGKADADSLKAVNAATLESYFSVLETIGPRNFRLGGGREEKDGSVSFLIRFIGRELAITGELFIRREQIFNEEKKPVRVIWIFEELILEDAQSRKEENDKSEQRFDFSPYHRFY